MEILTFTIELIAAIQLLAGLARHCSLGIALNDLQSSLANCGHNADTLLRLGAASIKDSRMSATGLSAKTLNSWTELLSGCGKAQTIRAMTSIETRPHERVVGLAQVICSIELQRITLSVIR